MAAPVSLSQRDIHVLGKIQDPETNPEDASNLDFSLPKDPHVTDAALYSRIVHKERGLILNMQQIEMELAGLKPKKLAEPIQAYRQCVADLGSLIVEHPNYASAHNNHAQALRRLYGDSMLLQPSTSEPLLGRARDRLSGAFLDDAEVEAHERTDAALTTLSDLDRCIALLMPRANAAPPPPQSPANSATRPSVAYAALSPTAAKTLSLAFTQRAALYYGTAKQMSRSKNTTTSLANTSRPESHWTKLDFQEAASHDFAMGGRFGNELARGLAVGTNPTAKLCGQMVQQMMKSEVGGSIAL